MNKVQWFIPVLLCLCLVGCASLVLFGAGAAAGVGGYKYYNGALTVIYQAPYTKTWDSSLKALESMNLTIESQEKDMTAGRIHAKRADGTPVTVSVAYKSAEETEVVIRVGVLGDRDASVAIKDEIRKTLF